MRIMEQNGNEIFEEQLKDSIAINDSEEIKRLISFLGVNYIFEDEDNESLILYAISDSGSEAYKTILELKPNINVFNNEGENIIHAIVYSGIISRLSEILKIQEIDLNHRAFDGSTPLLLAISLEKHEMAFELLKLGVNVNIADEEGITPLHYACQNEIIELVIELIKRGADLNQKTKRGNLPLALAVNTENIELIKYVYNKQFGNV